MGTILDSERNHRSESYSMFMVLKDGFAVGSDLPSSHESIKDFNDPHQVNVYKTKHLNKALRDWKETIKNIFSSKDNYKSLDKEAENRVYNLYKRLKNNFEKNTNHLPDKKQNIIGKQAINRELIHSQTWERAKNYDFRSAMMIVNECWTPQKTASLKKQITDPKSTILLTQPSSTKSNVIPIVLGEKLANEIGCELIISEHFFISTHKKQIKKITRTERPFIKKKYKLEKDVDRDLFKETFSGKDIILIDDIITTGGSVKEFNYALEQKGFNIKSVVALMGEKRLNMDENTKKHLLNALIDKDVNVDIEKLFEYLLTRVKKF